MSLGERPCAHRLYFLYSSTPSRECSPSSNRRPAFENRSRLTRFPMIDPQPLSFAVTKWRTALIAFAMMIAIHFCLVPAPAQPAEIIYDWSDELRAIQSAETIAQECFNTADDYLTRSLCAGNPTRICASQYDNGRQSQHDINTCAGFAVHAWERVLAQVFSELLDSGAAPKQLARSQAMWKDWNDFDCRAISDYVGTRAALDFAVCRATHASDRAFELKALIPK
jgi:uncharacterized protein YecT (DUF1311 family)